MSNHYTRYAFVVPMTQEQARDACRVLVKIASNPDERPDAAEFVTMCEQLAAQFDDDNLTQMNLTLRPAADGLLIASPHGETPPLAAAIIVQALLNYYNIDTPIGFAAAEYTDRMVVDGYGGLAVLVTKNHIADKSTSEILQDLKAAFT